MNLTRPAMRGLVALAADLGARLIGSSARGMASFDGVQITAASARQLAAAVDAAWPEHGEIPGALSAATAEGWTGWSAEWPVWTGTGIDVLQGPLPSDLAVVGLWWD